jgi:hypothetical protein
MVVNPHKVPHTITATPKVNTLLKLEWPLLGSRGTYSNFIVKWAPVPLSHWSVLLHKEQKAEPTTRA